MTTTPLAMTSSPFAVERFTRAELDAALRTVGIGTGDLLYVQVCADTLGPSEAGPAPEALCALLHDALRGAVGPEGTLLVPAYTFSFCRREAFDVQTSPTQAGPWNSFAEFPEYVRRLPGAIRSRDPIFSTAGVGPLAAELLTELPPVCLGPGSVHDRVRRAGGKICILGVGLYEAIARHSVEAEQRVPWRYDKLFTGIIRDHGEERKEGWIYNVRIRAANADPAGEALEQLARERGVCRAVPLGRGELLVVESQAFHELARAELARDPWSTARGPAGDPVALEAARVGAATTTVTLPPDATMEQMVKGLWRLPRDIVSEGYDTALAALAGQLPMTTHEYPSGTECWSWIVPEKWTCHEAYLETLDGRRLFSYADHPLHVVSYSLPYDGVVSREELLRHLHVHPWLPDEVPFIFKYYDRDWGLCCSQTQRDALTDAEYRVVIRSESSYGTLKVGEVVAPGETDECIVLCAHLCHPHMVNDDLSGVAVGMDVMRELLARPRRRYTYRFVIVPETIGSAAYLSHHEALIPQMKGGIFLEMLARPHPHALQRTYADDSEMNQVCSMVMRARDPDSWERGFRGVIGNDERQYNAPGVRVPMVSLSRVLPPGQPHYPFREYHSSADTPATASFEHLAQSRDMVLAMIDALEGNRRPVNVFRGEVFCARFGIHIDWYTNPEGHRALFEVMFHIDGTRTVADIAQACGISFDATRRTVDELARHGLVTFA
ncbi:MAG TPA: DUF4910 domain-containing protein [Gemmatimonadaceae bacterium]|nr:DUF4910 domain-containing protein [Gemmatimonadaceae bacterium]